MDTQNTFTLYMHIFPNGKVYIGITSRKTWERWSGGHGYSGQPLMHNAITKYGWKNIRHIVLADGMTQEEAEAAEVETIKKFRSTNRRYGYNIANGGSTGGKHTKETKAKMSASKSGENNPFFGRQLSEDHKKKIRETRKDRGIEPVNKQRVRCLETGIIYESTAQATRETGIHNYAIRRVCYGERKTAGGYHWEYISP